MPGRNLAKPFAIAGLILAEAYMLFAVLAPYSVKVPMMDMHIPDLEEKVSPGTPAPMKVKIERVLVCSLFFGPLGAIVGTGVGLMVSGLRGDFRPKDPAAK